MATVARNAPIKMTVTPTVGSRPIPSGGAAGATFTAEHIGPDIVLVDVYGEIDVLSAPALRAYVCDQLCADRRLILDLSKVDFIGTAGLAVFTSLDARSSQFGTDWALVGSRPVQRLLWATGRDSAFRCYESFAAAMGALRVLGERNGLLG